MNKSIDKDVITALADAITKYVTSEINSANYDKTSTGVLMKVLPQNEYEVKINGEHNSATLPSAVDGLKVTDKVRITTPSGKLEERFISSIIK